MSYEEAILLRVGAVVEVIGHHPIDAHGMILLGERGVVVRTLDDVRTLGVVFPDKGDLVYSCPIRNLEARPRGRAPSSR